MSKATTTSKESILRFERISKSFAAVTAHRRKARGSLRLCGLLILTMTVAGCETPPGEPQPEPLPAATLPASAPLVGVTTSPATSPASAPAAREPEPAAVLRAIVRLDDQDALLLHAAIGRINDRPVTYLFVAEQPTTQPASPLRTSYLLRSSVGTDPPIRCEVRYSDGGSRATITLSADVPLPEVSLLAQTLTVMRTVRITPPETDRVIQSAIGLASHTTVDGLYDSQRDWAIELEGEITCQPVSDGVVILAGLPEGESRSRTVLTVTSYRDFLKTSLKLEPAAQTDQQLQAGAPAGWTACSAEPGMNDQELLRNVNWLAVNLKPFGATRVRVAVTDKSVTDQIDRPGIRIEPCPPADQDRANTPPLEGGPAVVWNHVEKVARALMNGYWAHGIVRHEDPGPLYVGEPLSMDQARLWASLMGLSGQSLMVGGAIHALPAERVELLRKILPPAPIHAVDLFEHTQPGLWDLKLATHFGRWDVLGVFNWSYEPVRREVRLDGLGLDIKDGQQFAVYDIWEGRLVAVTGKSFALHVPPTGCRVVAIKQLEPDRPTLLGTNRHITHGAIDLADVYYDKEALTLQGTSMVVADIPYELRVFVPEGDRSFEIADVRVDASPIMVRQDGPIRTFSFQSDQSRSLDWTITFTKAAQQFEPPLPPTGLETRQDTRGVQLTWNARDDRAVFYHVYRDGKLVAEVPWCFFRDDHVAYNTVYRYEVTAVDWAGRESVRSAERLHRTPIPANANLTQLVPLSAIQDRLELGTDTSVLGRPLRVGGRRFRRGLGTHANARLRYFLGRGYTTFKGSVGIDDETNGAGSAIFKILGDGKELFSSNVQRGGERPRPFNVSVRNVYVLELLVTDAGDGSEGDHADWGNPYLWADKYRRPQPKPRTRPAAVRPAPGSNR